LQKACLPSLDVMRRWRLSLRGSYQKDKPRLDCPCGDGPAGQARSLLESEEEGPDDNL